MYFIGLKKERGFAETVINKQIGYKKGINQH